MTMDFIGESSAIRDAQAQLAKQFERRNATAENSARLAHNAFTYTTTGVGEIIVKQPVEFDCVFIQEPSFTSGVYIAKAPNTKLYHYPLVTAGVYKWIEELQKPDSFAQKVAALKLGPPSLKAAYVAQVDALKENEPKFYKGAYLYFVVRVDPLQTPRSDGSNRIRLEQMLLQVAPGTSDYLALQANITEANLAVKLASTPPQVTLHHHLQFAGVAMKKLSDAVTKLADDKAARPHTVYR